jgi:uncharacterized protein YeaO (DUF488 family)
MAIHVVRLGSPRVPNEGVRLGTVRRPPRGVAKEDFARRDYYDVWLPILAPSAELLSFAHAAPWTDSRWKRYARRYEREMNRPEARQLIETLAALSQQAHFAVGCYCEDATRCHRSLLSSLLKTRGALVVDRS